MHWYSKSLPRTHPLPRVVLTVACSLWCFDVAEFGHEPVKFHLTQIANEKTGRLVVSGGIRLQGLFDDVPQGVNEAFSESFYG